MSYSVLHLAALQIERQIESIEKKQISDLLALGCDLAGKPDIVGELVGQELVVLGVQQMEELHRCGLVAAVHVARGHP